MALSDLIPWKRDDKKIEVKRDAQYPMLSLQQEMNRLFDNFFDTGLSGLSQFGNLMSGFEGFSPQIDITETNKEINILAELPGLDENDVEVTLTDNNLTISGEKKSEKEDKSKNYHHIERSYGSFRRVIPLPSEIQADKVEAKFNKGILTVTLPKTKESQQKTKRIAVKKA